MKISDFLSAQAITVDLKAEDKEGVIKEMVELLISSGGIEKRDKNKLMETLMAREALGSTAIGQGLAIPHGKSEAVSTLTAGLGISKNGIDFDSLDGEPVYIFFLLVAPIDSSGPHLKALARISKILRDKYFRESLRQSTDEKAIYKLIIQEDKRTT